MNILNRLSLWKKLLVLMLGMLLPAVFLGYQYVHDISTQLDATQGELAGAQYLAAVTAVLNPISRHRGQTGAFLNGDAVV